MAETLPELRYRVYADHTEAVDLGGGSNHTWAATDGGSEEERTFIQYNFTASKGYTARQDDWSIDGQAVRFSYDLSENVYAQKRQFVLGTYAYVLDKSFEFSGRLPEGQADCFLAGTNKAGRIKLLRGLSESSLAVGERFLCDLENGTYQPVNMVYLYPRPGVTSNGLLTDEDYSANAEVRFSGVKGVHPPYADVVAEDVIPSVTGAHPVNQFADPTEPITLSWQMTYDEIRYAQFDGIGKSQSIVGRVYGKLTQKSARVRWTVDGETIHEINVSEESQCEIPANQVGAEGFRWQVDVCSSDGVWSESSDEWYQVRCDNDTLSTAKALRPQKITIDGTVENTFYWEHHNESGSRATAAELQYSQNGLEWIPFGYVVGRENECVIAENSLPSGQIWWRVRTYNVNGLPGEWSEPVPLTVRSAPLMPSSVLAGWTPQPEISWYSSEQIAAEVEINGEIHRVYGKTSQLKWPTVLADGFYILRIRVQNVYGLWSKWAETAVEIVNYPQANFNLTAVEENHSVRLKWNRSFDRVQIFCNEICIAELENQELEFVDFRSCGAMNYRLRGITEEGYYSESNTVALVVEIGGAVLAYAENPIEWIPLKGRYKAIPEHICRTEEAMNFHHYSGRKWPLAFHKHQWMAQHKFSFSIEKGQLNLLEKIRELSGREVIYKDGRGELVCGVLTEVLSTHYGLYADVEFKITEAEAKEGAAV